MENERVPGVAFFDVDDTILKGASGVMLAKYLFMEKGKSAPPSYIFDIIKALIDVKTGSVDYESLVEKGLTQFEGHSLAEMEEIALGCFDKYMRKSIYKMVYKEIVKHKNAGRKVVLLTASIQSLIDPLADFLGADKVIAMKPKFVNGKLTPHAEKPFCYHEGKLILAREYCQELGVDLKDCFFYSDSSSDLPLMEKVGHPRPTCPDPSLRRLALLKNWKMLFPKTVMPPDFRPEHWR